MKEGQGTGHKKTRTFESAGAKTLSLIKRLSRQNHNPCANRGTVIKVDHMFIDHPDTAI